MLNTEKLNLTRTKILVLYILMATFSILLLINAYLLFNSNKKSPTVYNFPAMTSAEGKASYALELPTTADFAGETVPLDNFDVKESFDREMLINTYWQSNTLLVIKRAFRHFPVIEPILKKNGVPDDFKYIVVIESAFTNAGSPAGAVGFWQFVKRTGKYYKLEITDQIDERYNIEKATQAACDYFKESYKVYKNWTLTAASYNVGRSVINSQLKHQKASNYYDMYLNVETARYIFRLLAVKEIFNNPAKYGYAMNDVEKYAPMPSLEVRVDTTINNLPAFAHKFGINYKILKMFNPWLRDKVLPNKSRKVYYIKIPKLQGYRKFDIDASLIDSLYLKIENDTGAHENSTD